MGRCLWYPEPSDIDAISAGLHAFMFPNYEPHVDRPLAGNIRDPQLLESALRNIQQPYFHSTIDRAGALLRSIVTNHAFVDGNKRIGLMTTFTFLFFNGYMFGPTNKEMSEFTINLADSQPPMERQEVSKWIRSRTIPFYNDQVFMNEWRARASYVALVMNQMSVLVLNHDTFMSLLRPWLANRVARAFLMAAAQFDKSIATQIQPLLSKS